MIGVMEFADTRRAKCQSTSAPEGTRSLFFEPIDTNPRLSFASSVGGIIRRERDIGGQAYDGRRRVPWWPRENLGQTRLGLSGLLLVALLIVGARLRRRPDRAPTEPNDESITEDALQMELAKLLLSSSLEYQRDISQALRTVTSLLLTSYIALYVAFGREYGFFEISPWVASLPVLLFGASLVSTLGRAVVYKGTDFQFGDIAETLSAYERAMMERRKQLGIPTLLTALGIVSFAVVVVEAV
jgi:hypothetical protein